MVPTLRLVLSVLSIAKSRSVKVLSCYRTLWSRGQLKSVASTGFSSLLQLVKRVRT
ncbi:Uncharacterised protein [Vibrio cholerae]|nr:Uncharacterised protein [Vibrio cholerae]CSC15560.1 Uncharacterised protein [Vibrio cholerae]